MNTGYNKELEGMAKDVYERIMARVSADSQARSNDPTAHLSHKV
jgi:hypothetical protein